jgi:hypothetical protein
VAKYHRRKYAGILFDIEQTPDGGYVLGGSSNSSISGDKTENGKGEDDYWVVKLYGNSNLIRGLIFADLNNNGIQDVGEFPVASKKITEQNTGRFTFSNQDGNYIVSVLDTGNFTVSPQSVNWYNPVPPISISSFQCNPPNRFPQRFCISTSRNI